jgi:hypothetical protein
MPPCPSLLLDVPALHHSHPRAPGRGWCNVPILKFSDFRKGKKKKKKKTSQLSTVGHILVDLVNPDPTFEPPGNSWTNFDHLSPPDPYFVHLATAGHIFINLVNHNPYFDIFAFGLSAKLMPKALELLLVIRLTCIYIHVHVKAKL